MIALISSQTKITIYSICLVSFLLCYQLGNAQQSFHPDKVTTNLLYLGDERGAEKIISLLTKQTFDLGSKKIIVQKHLKENGIVDMDSSVVEYPSFTPIFYHAELASSDRQETFLFNNTSVSGKIIQNGKKDSLSIEIDPTAINAIFFEDWLETSKINISKSLDVILYNPGKSLLNVSANLVSTETLDFLGVTIETFKIEITGMYLPVTIWLTTNTLEFIQQKTSLPNGKIFWKKVII